MINLMQGDCLEKMLDIPDGSVDMVMADPPYGMTQCKWDLVIPLDLMWEQLKRVIKSNGAIVLMGNQPFTSKLISSNLEWFKYEWVWKKSKATGHLNAKKQPLRDKEDIVVFYSKQPTYNPQMTIGPSYKARGGVVSSRVYGKYSNYRNDNHGFRYPKQIIDFNVGGRETIHPTQKPVKLMEYLIKTYTNENETVLDFCMGSGTTGEAALNLNRNFIGIEKDEKYFQYAKERLEKVLSPDQLEMKF